MMFLRRPLLSASRLTPALERSFRATTSQCPRNFSSVSTKPSKTNIGFVGLGNMGLPMCINLLRHKQDQQTEGQHTIESVTAFDLDGEAMTKAEMAGARPVASVAEIASQGDIDVIFTMLPGCAAARSVIGEILDNVPSTDGGRQLVIVDCSTISPITCKDLHESVRAKDPGYSMLDAPVSGGVKGAENATLTFMVGGEASTLEDTSFLLNCMGKNIIRCGHGGMGIVAKLCNNIALAAQMVGVCEAMNLGEALGIDPVVLAGVMNTSTAKCWSSEVNNPHPDVAAGNGAPASKGYEGGFGSSLMLKDVSLAVNAGEAMRVALPVGALSKELYQLVESHGHGKQDFGVMLEFLRGK